jgi:putative DNA methylase
MNLEIKKTKIKLQPLSLKDAPALIEKVFPPQKISAEAQKERKAGSGQTLTALGSYWKGRKPLIMVRAIVLASLLPATDDLEADLNIFEKLMGIDDASFGRREPKLKASEVATKVSLENPWKFFDYTIRKNKKI